MSKLLTLDNLETFKVELDNVLDEKAAGTKWNAITQGQIWSRICLITPTVGVEGFSGILSASCTRANVVCNATFMVTTSHNLVCNITQLDANSYSIFQIRGVTASNGTTYVELYDTAQSIASGTTQTWHCSWVPLLGSTITAYTTFTTGATVPSGYSANAAVTVALGKTMVADKFVGALVGNADTATSATSATSATTATTATTATKLGSSTVGSATKPIYLNAGTATAFSSTVGAAAKPVYMSSGVITACSSTVGAAARPVYMSSGTITACSSTVGSGVKPVYMSSGTITVSSSTAGSATGPVYLNAGTITECTGFDCGTW